MRIRKNAKLSSMIYPDGSRRESVHVCQLNQSPWDVIPFSEEPYPSSLYHQFETEDSFNGNGSLGDSIGAVESSVASMMESEDKPILKMEGMIIDDNDDTDEVIKIGEEFVFRSQCDEEDDSRQEGLLKSCSNINHSNDSENNPSSLTNKKAEKNNNQLTGSRRGRARAARRGSSSAASNPYEFYYYSGFGPLWGKRRGGGSDRAGGEISKNIDIENNSSAVTTQNNTTPSSSSQTQIDNNEEFDYVDDEDDDEEDDENGDSGKKRMRKPVKARSLKSLM